MKTTTATAAILAATLAWPATAQDDPLEIVFTHHSSSSNTFWQAVQKGFDDACEKVGASCQMIFTQTEGSVEQQAANMQAALARQPDAILTSIVDDQALDGILQDARDAGTIVIAVNVDDSEGAAGSPRQAFIGQGFVAAGQALAAAVAEQFPAEGDLSVLLGVSAPGQNWSEQRAQGIEEGLAAYAEETGRTVEVERIDSGTDLAVTSDRVGAYLAANPETNAYFDTGFWAAGVARVLRDRGVEPGAVLMGAFDLVPEVLREMEGGYVQALVDQQPYAQGFLPVMQVYLADAIGLSPSDVNTGTGVMGPDDVATIMDGSRQGIR
ncbi:substrate-binding domain-containing protein [Jannaschia sp. LMIT008]|uniref:substrate-binding domain-containing protein n=1 Tax=Jannaschia maritima TaxID=3032585 RepID=UPI0028113115|nr:substrate-binding domain-containing protein [Jannaschia sp. LMIT008]